MLARKLLATGLAALAVAVAAAPAHAAKEPTSLEFPNLAAVYQHNQTDLEF